MQGSGEAATEGEEVTPPEGISDVDQTKRDEERLAELGYKQEL